jgi:hypothetical protein
MKMQPLTKNMRTQSQWRDERGFALVEAVGFLIAFVILTAYTIDFFTIVHTGVVNSIAARTYLFETFQHRSDLTYLRQENQGQKNQPDTYFGNSHYRFHAVNDEDQPVDDTSTINASGRMLTQVTDEVPNQVVNGKLDNPNNKTSTVWIKTGYGICVDAYCPSN